MIGQFQICSILIGYLGTDQSQLTFSYISELEYHQIYSLLKMICFLLLLLSSCINGLSLISYCPRAGLISLIARHRFRHNYRRISHHRKRIVHDAEDVFHLLKSLPRDCYTYEDDHYTYEYCHMESARQYGRKMQNNLREEYNLGSYCPQRSIQKYSPLLQLAKVSLVDGDPCGDGIVRKTKVKFFCADPKMSMHIVNAREKSLCNYRILVHVPELCFK